VLEQLNGLFSFAIWDSERGSLFLARDHMGIKPLYYARTDNLFVFASEIKAIFASGFIGKAVNHNSIFHYLCRQEPFYLETMFQGVYELEPGTWIELGPSGAVTKGTYFTLEEDWRRISGLPDTEESLVPLVQEQIRACVQRQLVSDVPVGIFLSGGMDSAMVYKFMLEAFPDTLHAFTYANKNAEINELGKATSVINSFKGNVQHHVEHVELSSYLNLFQEACILYDAPVHHPSSIPILMLSRLASQMGIKVLMSGQGGDELFMGYIRYRRWILQGLPQEKDIKTWADHFYIGGGLDKVEWVERLTGSPRVAAQESPVYQWVFHNQDLPPLKRMAAFDQKFRLMYLLKRDDRMGMGGSVEIRVPFLDKELVSWANALDDRWKVNGLQLKYILNQASRHSLPAAIVDSPKMGSPVDFERWINTPDFVSILRGLVCDPDSFSRAYLCFDEVKRLILEHEGRFKYGHLAWCLFSLENWYRACFLNPAYPR
jgi:asparagine synthase (glutamine-hydrolysing)